MEDFLKLMIAELQNQDPLNPMDNSELVGQISQMRTITATDKMTETLDSVLLGQNISSATNLIGAEIDAISDDQQKVTGIVERVSVADGQPKLHLDLNPKANVTSEEGEIEAGEYEYRIVWQNDKGQSFAVQQRTVPLPARTDEPRDHDRMRLRAGLHRHLCILRGRRKEIHMIERAFRQTHGVPLRREEILCARG
jgi:flagellar hook assembly protein FlgD